MSQAAFFGGLPWRWTRKLQPPPVIVGMCGECFWHLEPFVAAAFYVQLTSTRSPLGSPCPPRCPAVSAALARMQAHPEVAVLVTVSNMTTMAECDMAVAETWHDYYVWNIMKYDMKINTSTQYAISKHALFIQQYSLPSLASNIIGIVLRDLH